MSRQSGRLSSDKEPSYSGARFAGLETRKEGDVDP